MTLQLSTITPKVTIHNGKAITTTDDVAHYFGKQHHHVVQKVESLECSEEFITRNFSRMIKNVQLAKGATREVVYYEMTKDGFVFLVMGFTGKKRLPLKKPTLLNLIAWKQSYILYQNTNPKQKPTKSSAAKIPKISPVSLRL
ncbi:Rha family transcriptional regulator [Arsenophonus nasoniae]|uniref:Rha family transcriptional regulator n=1 Tax=Arsenophonus nasoniae TaxID=638 RepID=A0ABY8NTH6_9GAMM|nr:Rha family transcriptional regulator [Arsenophonus nasoniae]WGM06665.1 Rha family transcriptional regulator [Arsenophonus nasoniae]WGM11606.1 Rha family transcriptional regulator [Arsenophonus nasoniae]